MAITAADVKALREATGAGMMECKKALTECNGDMAEAEKYLKEKGLAAMAKRAERATTEGRLFIRQDGNKIVVVELTCETDFVANNADFIAVGEKLLDVINVLADALGVEPKMEMLPMQAGDVYATYASIDKLNKAVGYEPKTTIREGIPVFAKWYKEYHGL